MTFSQSEFNIRCEWGKNGIRELAPISDAVIILDVMSFSTCVSIATARGAIVFPYRWRDDSKIDFAESVNAQLAGPRGKSRYSLSPVSLVNIPAGTRLVLPSPNGATLTLLTGNTPTFAGCLRNANAVARAAARCGKRISLIPAGERWKGDRTLRPAFEDIIGAGAVIQHLNGSLSPESKMAVAVFRDAESDLFSMLKQCSSGKELIAMGYEEDITLIAQMDADGCAPVLRGDAFVNVE